MGWPGWIDEGIAILLRVGFTIAQVDWCRRAVAHRLVDKQESFRDLFLSLDGDEAEWQVVVFSLGYGYDRVQTAGCLLHFGVTDAELPTAICRIERENRVTPEVLRRVADEMIRERERGLA